MSEWHRRSRNAAEWDARYVADDVPWDVRHPSPYLIAFVEGLDGSLGRVLELGCGTGSDALWLASQGISVVAVDIAPRALEIARARAADAGLEQLVTFLEVDLVRRAPVENASVDLVFDRGMFHSVVADQRPILVRRAHDALKPGGRWLTLVGNADDTNVETGPRRLTAQEVVASMEPLFRVISLRAVRMDVRNGSPLMWEGVLEPRPVS